MSIRRNAIGQVSLRGCNRTTGITGAAFLRNEALSLARVQKRHQRQALRGVSQARINWRTSRMGASTNNNRVVSADYRLLRWLSMRAPQGEWTKVRDLPVGPAWRRDQGQSTLDEGGLSSGAVKNWPDDQAEAGTRDKWQEARFKRGEAISHDRLINPPMLYP